MTLLNWTIGKAIEDGCLVGWVEIYDSESVTVFVLGDAELRGATTPKTDIFTRN